MYWVNVANMISTQSGCGYFVCIYACAYFSRVSVLFESSKQADLDEQNRLFSRLRNFQVIPDVVLVLDEMPACESGEGGWEGVFRGEGVGRFRRRKSID
ncbi:hypothetical protein D917_02001 [Trichinella nativa]|uniref:Uncharacterized protein n=1 Tax=Trichinella nativa TaxID=6335 RepID=A0A1Y3EKB5_9BILA|nr:hypothetical protein D917_02001 [Trichinella nativa]